MGHGSQKCNGKALALLFSFFVNSKGSPVIEGKDRQPGKANYYIGRNPKNWKTDVPIYTKTGHYFILGHFEPVLVKQEGFIQSSQEALHLL